jgi:hypothetical protein
MAAALTPTVGQIVWYYPGSFDDGFVNMPDESPFAAIVAFVAPRPETLAKTDEKVPVTVNLAVFEANGWCYGRQNVLLIADDEDPPAGVVYAGLVTRKAKTEREKKAAADVKAAADKKAADAAAAKAASDAAKAKAAADAAAAADKKAADAAAAKADAAVVTG